MSSSVRVKRSVIFMFVVVGVSPRGEPGMPTFVMPPMPLKFVVSTTSVLPSKCPRDSPIHCLMAGSSGPRPSTGITRASWIISSRTIDVAGSLMDLDAVVVVEREHRRRQAARDAAIPRVEVRRLVEHGGAPAALHLRRELLAARRELGEAAVLRLDEQRRQTRRIVVVARFGPMAHAHLVGLDLFLVALVARGEPLLRGRVLFVRELLAIAVDRIALLDRRDVGTAC